MSALVYVAPQCPGCDGAGCGTCGGSGVARDLGAVDCCSDCGRGWRECVCDESAPCVMDVAAGYAAERMTT